MLPSNTDFDTNESGIVVIRVIKRDNSGSLCGERNPHFGLSWVILANVRPNNSPLGNKVRPVRVKMSD